MGLLKGLSQKRIQNISGTRDATSKITQVPVELQKHYTRHHKNISCEPDAKKRAAYHLWPSEADNSESDSSRSEGETDTMQRASG